MAFSHLNRRMQKDLAIISLNWSRMDFYMKIMFW